MCDRPRELKSVMRIRTRHAVLTATVLVFNSTKLYIHHVRNRQTVLIYFL